MTQIAQARRLVGAWIDPEQQRRLAEVARVNERSVSGEIRRAINAHLRREWLEHDLAYRNEKEDDSA